MAARGLNATLALMLGLAALAAGPAVAQDFPNKPIRLVVPFPPGGAGDASARLIADKLPAELGQPVVVENKPGANTSIGIESVARSTPDGYTIGLMSSGATILPATMKAFAVDLQKDIAPIAQLNIGALILGAHPSVAANDVPGLIAFAKANPGKLNFGSSGPTDQLAGELFKSLGGVNIVHVPYKGGAPLTQGLLAGEVQLVMLPVLSLKQHIDAGKVKALAVTSPRPSSLMPGTPTVGQTLNGFESAFWFGLFAPAGTPPAVIERINKAANAVLARADVRDQLAKTGTDPLGGTPAAFAKVVVDETARWTDLARKAGIQPE